jgi:uncharacterized repeat protein (TIGR01451 family)
LTIQAAVVKAASGDTINVAAGTYSVVGANLNKALTLSGAQAGVDARDGRPGALESIIAGSGFGTFHLSAANITFDGFTFSNLKGRELDSTTNADNFTMRNCILQGSSIDPGYNTGAIQFGGGLSLHANGLLFEQNLVTADNGELFYMGHAMDNGTIRNNKFHGDTVSFGPFGNRTGWVIEGNEFNGDVLGHGPYWGFGFNANLGDVIIRNNNIHQMSVGIGQISVVGGSITGNTFTDNDFGAIQLWGGEFGSVVSANVQITNNTFNYNGDINGNQPYAIRLRPDVNLAPSGTPGASIDASTIHVNRNGFFSLGVGTYFAIRNQGDPTTTLDDKYNWWGQSTGPLAGQNSGPVNTDPYISAYVDDPAHFGQLGFWPLVTTNTTIDSDTPDPSIAGSGYTVSGTVEVTGLGGVISNLAALPGQVMVFDGTDTCTDTTLSDSGPLNKYAFSCSLTSTTTGAKTLTATYTDTSADPFYNTSFGTAPHNVQLTTTISINNIPVGATVGGTFTPTYAYIGDGTPSVTSSTPIECTVSGGIVSFVGVGMCTLTAHATAGTNYAAVDGSPQSFTITINDTCPNDPNKTAPGACGCGVPDTDSDGDGIPDCHEAPADLRVTKTAKSRVKTGTKLTYVVTVRNNGPNSAPNVVITDTMPAGTTFVSANPTRGTCSNAGNLVTCNIGTLANHRSAAIIIVVKVTAPNGTILNNTAQGSSSYPDPNLSNNADSARTKVVKANDDDYDDRDKRDDRDDREDRDDRDDRDGHNDH